MHKTRTRSSGLFGLCLLLLLPACASGPPPGPSPAALAGMAAEVVVVSPFNIVSALPPELEGSTKIVSRALVAHLEAHGKTVKRIGFRAGRDLWAASMQEVREKGEKRNFDNAARVYARKIGEHVEFDVVIVPSLFVQNAKARFRKARWDDAEQTLETEGSLGDMMFQGQQGTLNVRAASLFVVVLDREGHEILSKRRGLEVIEHLRFVEEAEAGYSSKKNHDWGLVPDKPPIEDAEMVRQGVAAALSPFLPEEPPAPEAQATANPEAEPASE